MKIFNKIKVEKLKDYITMTDWGRFSIIRRMAVLWEQRKMVRELKRLENEEIGKLPYAPTSLEEQIDITYMDTDGYWLWESILIKEILKIQGTTDSDIVAINAIKKVLNSCINDKFILQQPNETFFKVNTLPKGTSINAKHSPRRIRVSEDKGTELLNGWYFWWKYIAGSFPPLTSIVVAVLTALLTSGVIWWFALRKIQNVLIPPVEHEQQTQVSSTPQ